MIFDFFDDLFDLDGDHSHDQDHSLEQDSGGDSHPHDGPVQNGHGGHEVRFGGYSNADGTYHWSSDNTDRDPQTGAIIRRW